MKKIILLLALLLTAVGFSQSKVGTIDINYILSKMPEISKVKENLDGYGKSLDKQLNEKIAAYQSSIEDYKSTSESLSQANKRKKQDSIISLEDDITKFRQNGAKLIQLREDELTRPLYQKIATALEKVAAAEKFTQVLSLNDVEVVYLDPTYDITEKVMQEMGIPVEEE